MPRTIEARAEREFVTSLQALEVPFKTRHEAGEALKINGEEKIELDELEREKLQKIVQILRHPGLQSLIERGKITLAMIKPQAYDGRDLPSDDDQATKALISKIG